MWENIVGTGQATDGNMAHALCMLDKYSYKHTLRYVIVLASPWQHWRLEHAGLLPYAYIGCLVNCMTVPYCSCGLLWYVV